MGAGQSADTTTPGKLQTAARRAFFKEHGRDPTEEEVERFTTAYDRDDPTDNHLGPVTAEEADVHRDTASELLHAAAGREPTDDELGPFTEKLARAFRRAALEAVSDIETARRELVRRAVDAEKASAAEPKQGGVEVVPFGPPPRPADESAAESPFERAARLEHEKVRVVAAVAHAADSKKVVQGLDNLISLAEDDKKWDLKVETCVEYLAKLGADSRELHTAAADRAIAEANRSNPYATELEGVCRDAYANVLHGGSLDYPSLSSDDAAEIGLDYENVPWEGLEAVSYTHLTLPTKA